MTLTEGIEKADRSVRRQKPRILLSAYQCAPGLGSVSQIGWEWYHRLSQRAPVTLVTHVRNRQPLTAAGAPLEGSELIYIDTEWFAGPLYRLAISLFPKSQHAVFLMSSLDFYVYDHAAVAELRRRVRSGSRWDLVHAVTPVSPVASTRLHRLGLPLILGPWNGGLRSPANFPEIMAQDSGWLYPVRNAGKVIDLILGGTRHAIAIFAATQATREALPASRRKRTIDMVENGVDLARFTPTDWPYSPHDGRPLRILFVGRLLPFKGVPMLLEAAGRIKTEFAVEVRIVGEGPMLGDWKKQAEVAGLSDAVRFCGPAPLSEIPQHLSWCHIFCLPSVRESGGAVLLEAMAAARPAVAVGYGGPAELIDDSVGRTVPATGRQAVVDGLVDVFREVVARPDAWRRRGVEGRCRAESLYGWESKIDRALSIYDRLLSAS